MKQTRDFTGVWIPKEIWEREDMNISEKCLLVDILNFNKSKHGCFASNAFFAKFLGCSVATVKRMLKKLIEYGLIFVEENYRVKKSDGSIHTCRKIGSNYIIGLGVEQKEPCNGSKRADPPAQNDPHISISTININDKDIPLENKREVGETSSTEKSTPQARLVGEFKRLYKEKYGEDAVADARHYIIFASLLKQTSEETILDHLDEYFENESWLTSGTARSVEAFRRNFQALAPKKKKWKCKTCGRRFAGDVCPACGRSIYDAD